MSVRRRYATTSQDIMEADIEVAVKKAKARYSDSKFIYISKTSGYYFADSSDLQLTKEIIARTYENTNYAGNEKQRAKWVLVYENKI